jgi:glycosyltransferase involved in cell wall biosynthesis
MQNIKLNVIIPAYNEEKRIGKTLRGLAAYIQTAPSHLEIDTYIVDDGSKDGTAKVVKQLAAELGQDFHIPSYGKNRGKGYAVKFGMLQSQQAHYYYLADADMSSPWQTISELLDAAIGEDSDSYDCVIGSRAAADARVSSKGSRKISGRISNLIIRGALGLAIKDTQCGYKLFKSTCIPAFRAQILDRFGFDFEILYLIKKLGLRTLEKGIEWEHRDDSKVRFSDYFRTFTELLKVRTHPYKI